MRDTITNEPRITSSFGTITDEPTSYCAACFFIKLIKAGIKIDVCALSLFPGTEAVSLLPSSLQQPVTNFVAGIIKRDLSHLAYLAKSPEYTELFHLVEQGETRDDVGWLTLLCRVNWFCFRTIMGEELKNDSPMCDRFRDIQLVQFEHISASHAIADVMDEESEDEDEEKEESNDDSAELWEKNMPAEFRSMIADLQKFTNDRDVDSAIKCINRIAEFIDVTVDPSVIRVSTSLNYLLLLLRSATVVAKSIEWGFVIGCVKCMRSIFWDITMIDH